MNIIFFLSLLIQVGFILADNGESSELKSEEMGEDEKISVFIAGGAKDTDMDSDLNFVIRLVVHAFNGLDGDKIDGKFWICTGSALSARVILTSSACIHQNNQNPTFIGVQSFDKNGIWHEHFVYDDEIISSPDSSQEGVTLIVIKSDSEPLSVWFPKIINFPHLPTQSDMSDSRKAAIIAGWGATSTEKYPSYLQTANVGTTPNKFCQRFYGSTITKDSSCILELTTGACVGDDGGPLLIRNGGGSLTIIGVNKYHPTNCGAYLRPSVYLNVLPYVDWIRKYL